MSEENETPWPKGSLAPFGKQVIDHNQKIVAQCKTPELSLLFSQAPAILQQRDELLAACKALVTVAGLVPIFQIGDGARALDKGIAAIFNVKPTNHAPENQPADECPCCHGQPHSFTVEIHGVPATSCVPISTLDALLDQLRAIRKIIGNGTVLASDRIACLVVSLEGIEETLERMKAGQS